MTATTTSKRSTSALAGTWKTNGYSRLSPPASPTGLKVDRAGRVYASSLSGVQIFDLDGELLGEIDLPGVVNFCFGGPAADSLLITTDSAVWAATLAAKGA